MRGHMIWLFNHPGRKPPEQGFKPYLLVSAVGVAGFVLLLLLSTSMQESAAQLRAAALIWFFIFGILRLTLFWKK